MAKLPSYQIHPCWKKLSFLGTRRTWTGGMKAAGGGRGAGGGAGEMEAGERFLPAIAARGGAWVRRGGEGQVE